MRNFLIVLFLSLTLSLPGATYYVATNGSDSNPGTLSQPWGTLQKAFNSISPGDILYVRGGTYTTSGTIGQGWISGVLVSGKKGSSSSMYQVFNYPGEVPVLDCRNITNSSYSRIGICLVNSNYWHIKGIEITRVDQYNGSNSHGGQGLMIQSGNFNKIENVVAHHNGGPGLGLRDDAEGNLFLNCDAYSNYDPYSDLPGGDADGFDIGFITARSGNDRVNTLIGCRSWSNSDDGFDMYLAPGYHGIYILRNCWAFKNGYRSDGTTEGGDGNGFKYGADNNYSLDATVRRTSTNCIAYANRQRGFSQESAYVKMLFYNNTAYKNGSWGFSFYDYDVADILRNNISYKNTDGQIENQGSNRIHDHNSWDSKVTLSDADFSSLDATQLTAARKSDGSLPDISFLHLATGSDLIDAGVNVGLTYYGNAPDMGAFEVSSASNNVAPLYLSSSVENAAPSSLVLNYDQDLNNLIVPAASAFSVLVNSSSRTVSSVSVSGKKVTLTLASAVKAGDAVTIAYTKPSSSPIQTAAGMQAESFTAQPVTNNVQTAVPVYVSSVIQNSAPAILEMTYSLSLASIVPSASSFRVLVNSSSRTVSSVSVSGTKVLLTLSSAVVYGNTVTVSYTKPSSNPLQTSEGGQAASLSAQAVTNNVQSTVPVYVSSVIQNATPSVLEISYSLTLANVVPAASAFTVMVNSAARSISSLTISGSKVFLTLSSAVVAGNTVTVAYTKPTANPLQSTNGGQAATLAAQQVTNNVASVANKPPVISITSPANNLQVEAPANLTLTASASDPDGTVTLVEFYLGSTRIGSKSSAPYTFAATDLTSGVYNFTAVVTDNLGAKTTSALVRVTVYDGTPPPPENEPPVIDISSPSKGYRFDAPADIEFSVDATDPDGTVTRVELFNGSTRIATLTTAPFTYVWKGVSEGTYNIKAVATDNQGATDTSAVVGFTVEKKPVYDADSEIINLYPNPSDGHFTIDFLVPLTHEKNEIIVSDMSGNQVYRDIVSQEETSKLVDLPHPKTGLYILMVVSEDIIVTKKVMIK